MTVSASLASRLLFSSSASIRGTSPAEAGTKRASVGEVSAVGDGGTAVDVCGWIVAVKLRCAITVGGATDGVFAAVALEASEAMGVGGMGLGVRGWEEVGVGRNAGVEESRNRALGAPVLADGP
jgi:hypothetical protein